MPRICITPRVEGIGGVASFRMKLEGGLRKRGLEVTYEPGQDVDAILVLAGTRRLLPLWMAKRRGTRIVQRLDGINWVQRVRWSGVRYTLRAEYGNALLSFIRSRVADQVVYQSNFIRSWWEGWYGPVRTPSAVILNAVDLEVYSPGRGKDIPPWPPYRLLVVEGSLAGGLDTGLMAAAGLAERLSRDIPVDLSIAGMVDPRTQNRLERMYSFPVHVLGAIPHERVIELMQTSHLFVSAEINPPCPNSVIEALACGLPVVGFDTGSLQELVGEKAGVQVPYGGDPWKLGPPDVPALAQAAAKVLHDQAQYRLEARARAEAIFGVDQMVDAYLKVLLDEGV